MNVNKQKKVQLVSDIRSILNSNGVVIITKNHGLTVAEAKSLRKKIKAASGGMMVAKNTLIKLALEGTQFEKLSSEMTGPTAITYSNDPVGVSKVVTEFVKENEKLELCSGAMNGTLLSKEDVISLSSLPSMDELRGKIVGLIMAPATKIAQVLQAPAGQLARVISAYSNKD